MKMVGGDDLVCGLLSLVLLCGGVPTVCIGVA